MFNNAISDIIELHIKDLDKSENGIYGKLNQVNRMLVVIFHHYLGYWTQSLESTWKIENWPFLLLFSLDDSSFCSGFCPFRYSKNLGKHFFGWQSTRFYELFCHFYHNHCKIIHPDKLVRRSAQLSAKYRLNNRCFCSLDGCQWIIFWI